jgi:hypothetical protein
MRIMEQIMEEGVVGKILLAREDNINDNGRSLACVSSKRSNSRTVYKEVNSKNKGKVQLTNMYTISRLGGSYGGGSAIGKGEMDLANRAQMVIQKVHIY